jgi:ABC-2 type transport system ATP-binding protein
LDEPTTGLDPVARHEILRELTNVMADEGRSILFSSHNTQDVEQISDQITFIDRGRVIDSMDKKEYLDRWRRLRLEGIRWTNHRLAGIRNRVIGELPTWKACVV